MQLYLIRHAQSENNALYASSGSYDGRVTDPALSKTGLTQANILAQFLVRGEPSAKTDEHDTFNRRGFDITHIYCSLQRRSIETALAISKTLNLPAAADSDLHEWGGVFEIVGEDRDYVGEPGPNRSYFQEQYPTLVLPEDLGNEGWWNRPHEPRQDAFARARKYLDRLLKRHGASDDNIALVTHAGFYHSLMATISQIPLDPENERWMTGVLFAMNNAAISRVAFRDNGIVLAYLNRVDFLPKELIT